MRWSINLLYLTVALAAFWALLSGHYNPLMIAFATGSVIATVWLAQRAESVDHSAPAIALTWRIVTYLPWLAWEIAKSNWDVAKIVLSPRIRVSPTLFTTTASQRTDLGRVIYANSITLTPGTVTIDQDGPTLTVHALTREGAAVVMSGEMDRKVTAVEGAPQVAS